MKTAETWITAHDARRLFLGAQGLLDEPGRRLTLRGFEQLIKKLGFVQIDSINYVERAHHLTLAVQAVRELYGVMMADRASAAKQGRLPSAPKHKIVSSSAVPYCP